MGAPLRGDFAARSARAAGVTGAAGQAARPGGGLPGPWERPAGAGGSRLFSVNAGGSRRWRRPGGGR